MDLIDDAFDSAPTLPVLTVSELNRMARRALESQLPLLWVEGEVSNFIRAASGHWYFSLKDAGAQVRCVVFRGRNQFAGFTPVNGDHVELRALPSLYEARGEFQLAGESIRRAGAGRLFEAFLKLKAKLEAEGLFDPLNKRALPRFPRCIGIVTSPQAAALHDVLTALARRMPGLPVILYPTPVQGAGAGAQIAAAIRRAGQRAECDVLLVCRGGGSLEDLWAFNDEAVARAIAASPMPVVSGVGHETDFTLADFAADLRAPTPTAAAELASPVRQDLLQQLGQLARQLHDHLTRKQRNDMQRLDYLARRLVHPAEQLRQQQLGLRQLAQRLGHATRNRLTHEQHRMAQLKQRLITPGLRIQHEQHNLNALQARVLRAAQNQRLQHQSNLARLSSSLAHLNPEGVLARGYSIVQKNNGRVVDDAATLNAGDVLVLRFHRGQASATVDSVLPGAPPQPAAK
ncbi:MAG: exodeoxyribonuclease VII large subunit [Hydrogenophilales bacterium RIFOXYD1_FULL_62_11]|nr:MAG: exodeoxyribonuclease VII large subunit [Hydrogenophilales bacterium RIFOXYD1_FULL_62_11]